MAAADLSRIGGFGVLFTLLCVFASSPMNGETLDEVKARHAELLENHEVTKAHYRIVNLYAEQLVVVTNELEYLLTLEANNPEIRPRLEELRGSVKRSRLVKKQSDDLLKKIMETDEELRQQGEIIKYLNTMPEHTEL